MTQPTPCKILSTLGLNKACTVLFLERSYTPKPSCQLRYESPLINPAYSLLLYRCRIRLGCYIHPLGDSESSLRFIPPPLKRTREATLISSVMTQPIPYKILFVLALNNAYTVLFMERSYTPKRVLSIEVWITPYNVKGISRFYGRFCTAVTIIFMILNLFMFSLFRIY